MSILRRFEILKKTIISCNDRSRELILYLERNRFRPVTFLLRSLIVGLPIISSPAASEDEQLTVVSLGGAFTESQIQAYMLPFYSEYGIPIEVQNYRGDLDELAAQVASGHVYWSVMNVGLEQLTQGCNEGLFERIDPSVLNDASDGTPASADFVSHAIQPCAVGTSVRSTVIAFSEQTFAYEQPSRVTDLFDLDRFPGKRGLVRRPHVVLEWSLLADGVPPDQIYQVLSTEIGIERALRQLERIGDDVIWMDSLSEAQDLLAHQKIVMAQSSNTLIANSILEQELPVDIIWDGQLWAIDYWAVPANSENLDTAVEFIRFSTSTERLSEQANAIYVGPTRQSSLAFISSQAEEFIPTSKQNFENSVWFDELWWRDNEEQISFIFEDWLASGL